MPALPSETYLQRSLALVLRSHTAAADITPTVLGRKVGINPQTVLRILRGRRPATVYEFLALCHGLDIPHEALLADAIERAAAAEADDVLDAQEIDDRLRRNL